MKIKCLLNSRFRFPVALSLVGALALVYLGIAHAQVVIDGFTTVKPYVVPVTGDYCDGQEKVETKLSLFPPFLVFNSISYSIGLL